MADLTVHIVAADREVWTGTARQVVAKTTIGEIGILAGHEPVLATLAAGEVRVTPTDGGAVIKATADDGFLSFDHNVVTIVARDAALIQ